MLRAHLRVNRADQHAFARLEQLLTEMLSPQGVSPNQRLRADATDRPSPPPKPTSLPGARRAELVRPPASPRLTTPVMRRAPMNAGEERYRESRMREIRLSGSMREN